MFRSISPANAARISSLSSKTKLEVRNIGTECSWCVDSSAWARTAHVWGLQSFMRELYSKRTIKSPGATWLPGYTSTSATFPSVSA